MDKFEWGDSRLKRTGSWESQTNNESEIQDGEGRANTWKRSASRLSRTSSWDSQLGEEDVAESNRGVGGGTRSRLSRTSSSESRLSRTSSSEALVTGSENVGGRGTRARGGARQSSRLARTGSWDSMVEVDVNGAVHAKGPRLNGARPASRLTRTSSWDSREAPMDSPFSRRGFVETVRSLSQTESPNYSPLNPNAGNVSPVRGVLVRRFRMSICVWACAHVCKRVTSV